MNVFHSHTGLYNLTRDYSGSIIVNESWIALVRDIPYISNPKHQQNNITYVHQQCQASLHACCDNVSFVLFPKCDNVFIARHFFYEHLALFCYTHNYVNTTLVISLFYYRSNIHEHTCFQVVFKINSSFLNDQTMRALFSKWCLKSADIISMFVSSSIIKIILFLS